MKSHRASIIIIGTGVGGLAAAKTYLELDPEADILLLEKRSGLGGVWAEENCYDGLKTNNLRGTYEFTDFPLDDSYGVKEGEHIPGLVLYRYMTDFALKFDIFRRIRFNVNIRTIEKLDKGGWELVGEDGAAAEKPIPVSYRCEKLIMCTGLASTPNPVSYPGRDSFGKPVLNHGQLKVEAHEVASDPNVKFVTIVGASKTGYDAVQLMASRGKKVTWVIRESGGGGVWMSPPWVKMGPFTLQLEHVATMRFFTWFSPCVWGEYDGYSWVRRFLHGTRLGRTMVHRLWEKIRMDTVNFNGYRKDEAISKLEPYESLFWSARVGVLNYPGNIHDYVTSGQVKIIKKDISHLSKNGTINLSDGTSYKTDVLIAITGWKLSPNIQYKPDGIEASLGIPTESMSSEEQAFWTHLDKEAESEILQKFPYLTHPPKNVIPYKQKVSPYRLYRGMAPPGLTSRSDNSIVFIKMVHSTANMIIAETQALWAYAYLNKMIDIDKDRVYKETALSSCYGRLRYPCGFSAWYPEFVYDTVPYADMLLRDVGVCNYRKQGSTQEIQARVNVLTYLKLPIPKGPDRWLLGSDVIYRDLLFKLVQDFLEGISSRENFGEAWVVDLELASVEVLPSGAMDSVDSASMKVSADTSKWFWIFSRNSSSETLSCSLAARTRFFFLIIGEDVEEAEPPGEPSVHTDGLGKLISVVGKVYVIRRIENHLTLFWRNDGLVNQNVILIASKRDKLSVCYVIWLIGTALAAWNLWSRATAAGHHRQERRRVGPPTICAFRRGFPPPPNLLKGSDAGVLHLLGEEKDPADKASLYLSMVVAGISIVSTIVSVGVLCWKTAKSNREMAFKDKVIKEQEVSIGKMVDRVKAAVSSILDKLRQTDKETLF
ncbi:dimethylaniline monooxygenase [Fusarium agapanthi]|uniref:Dimethylaniline monooxygenase n=1 Tax=Fusarium agapanthi TaxID=1803897 RepID=A0A9P5BKX8_9HYPO|nr:dimethylaniline monooxygenase [Fusarium agapanthi]